jgi:hypothetical protein
MEAMLLVGDRSGFRTWGSAVAIKSSSEWSCGNRGCAFPNLASANEVSPRIFVFALHVDRLTFARAQITIQSPCCNESTKP